MAEKTIKEKLHKNKNSADTVYVGGIIFRREYKEGLPKTVFSIAFQFVFRFIENKKTARAFFAEIYRSGNAAGDYCKATLWHTQTSA